MQETRYVFVFVHLTPSSMVSNWVTCSSARSWQQLPHALHEPAVLEPLGLSVGLGETTQPKKKRKAKSVQAGHTHKQLSSSPGSSAPRVLTLDGMVLIVGLIGAVTAVADYCCGRG